MMKWTAEKIEYFKKVYPYNSNYKIADCFGCSYSAVKNMANRHGLKKDVQYSNKGYYGKGNIPWNKGKRGLQIGGKETQFKKGDIPANFKHEGTISIRGEYKYIKVGKDWILYHRYLWEQKFGKIPAGMILVFRDKNSMNCKIENPKLITRKEHAMRNHNRIKAVETIKKTWQLERIRAKYGLPAKTKLPLRCTVNSL